MTEPVEILKKYFGYNSFREGQELLIEAILAGRDVLGIMPTGAGKSVCYQVPALLLPGVTIVVSPLISLMKDQVQALNQAGIHAAYLNSSLTEGQIVTALRLAAGGRYKIIYVAPERLETYGFLQLARQIEISMLTVDEAHCISQWGQDFRPSYLNILPFLRQLVKRPIVSAFTATATERVQEDITCVLGLMRPQILVTGFDRKNLFFVVETPKKKLDYTIRYVQDHLDESGVVYCATRKNVELVYEQLLAAGISVTKYHAGLEQEERRKNQEAFMYDQKPVMVATNAFGMGIDKSNIRYVLHYNMPQSMENYYQEAGRAGRDLERLRQMSYYAMTRHCLRKYILHYFGEEGKGRCENCSNCQKEFEEVDVTEEAGKILACVQEMRQRYGSCGSWDAFGRGTGEAAGIPGFPVPILWRTGRLVGGRHPGNHYRAAFRRSIKPDEGQICAAAADCLIQRGSGGETEDISKKAETRATRRRGYQDGRMGKRREWKSRNRENSAFGHFKQQRPGIVCEAAGAAYPAGQAGGCPAVSDFFG